MSLFSPVKTLFSKNRQFYRKIKSNFGFCPHNHRLYEIAFTHRSAPIKVADGSVVNNERLEFLGDAILDAVVADFLFKRFPNENEGFLTQMRSKIVKREFLNVLARKVGLDKFLVAHTNNSSPKRNLYGDALEAFLGAIYLDMGYKFTKKFIEHDLISKHIDLDKLRHTDTNYKSQLLEWIQKYKKEMSIYTDTDPTQAERFISYVRIEQEIYGSGVGRSKKEAEQNAAEKALFKVNGNGSVEQK